MSSLLDLANKVKQFVQTSANTLGSGVRNFVTDLPANSAYLQAKATQYTSPKWNVETPTQLSAMNQQYQNASPLQKLGIDNPMGMQATEKSFSARQNPYPVIQQTPQNIQLEKQKQAISGSGVFRPAMSRYLSTVPVNASDNMPGSGVTTKGRSNPGASWETSMGSFQPLIEMGVGKNRTNYDISPRSVDPNLTSVLAHELIHASPRNDHGQEFTNFYNSLDPVKQPLLYKAGLTYLRNGQKPPNPEELYATLAQQLGPQVLQIPEVKKYYDNVFNVNYKQVNNLWKTAFPTQVGKKKKR